jgi:hypothetical protein
LSNKGVATRGIRGATLFFTFGGGKNDYYLHAIQNQLLMDVLFEMG